MKRKKVKCGNYALTLLILIFPILEASSNSLELRLEFGGTSASCINPIVHDGYCMSLTLDQELMAKPAFKCYLNKKLVYNCSSDGRCTDHGPLRKNTRPIEAAEGCVGIPFANINHDSVGKYTCLLSDDLHLIDASFKLYFCNEMKELKVRLLENGEEVKCFRTNATDVSGFCLSVGKKTDINHFQCLLNGELVYTCQSSDQCQGRGILQESAEGGGKYTVPRDISNNCWGIPFTNMDITMLGNYTCFFDTVKGSYNAKVCHQKSSENPTQAIDESEPKSTEDSWNTMSGFYIAVVVFLVLLVVFLPVIIHLRLRKKTDPTIPTATEKNKNQLLGEV